MKQHKMNVITIQQPWASLVIEPREDTSLGIKDIENRTWPCPIKHIGERVLIHAGMDNHLSKLKYGDTIQFMNQEQIDKVLKEGKQTEIFGSILPTGAIIGSVEIVDCVINHPSIWAEKSHAWNWLRGETIPKEIRKTIYNWVLANPIKFPEPIPAKGKLRFWDFDMSRPCPEFSHFGARYPDARCIDGYLWDMDSDENGYLTSGGDDPCPYCNPDKYLEQY